MVVEKNNYSTKTVNLSIVYDSNGWPSNPLNNFVLKSCLFDATNFVKNSNKSKYVYSGYGIKLWSKTVESQVYELNHPLLNIIQAILLSKLFCVLTKMA